MQQSMVPTEIWSHILQCIPRIEQTKLLEVSHIFHDIALHLVFSSVKIYFLEGDQAYDFLNTAHVEFVQECTEKLVTNSYEILRRIVSDPAFAKAVKSVTVIAFSDSTCIFEQLCLTEALQSLPHLRTFRWSGTHPRLSDTVAIHLPASIQKVVLQTYVPSLKVMQRFRDLRHLDFTIPFLYPDDEEAHDATVMDPNILSAVEPRHFNDILSSSNYVSLECLSLDGECVSGMPIRILGNLRELTISITTECENLGLDLVYRHASRLESLTLVGLIGQEIFPILVTDSSSLPSLHSFRLVCDNITMGEFIESEWMDSLFQFVGERRALRRLYIRIPSINLEETSHHLELLPKLKHLEVFGLHTGLTLVNDAFITGLIDVLPHDLKAFHLGMEWVGGPLLNMVDHLTAFPHLSFAHFYGAFSRLPLQVMDLVTDIPTLQLVGLNRALWDVDRSSPEVEIKKWPRWKVKFCTEEDFDSGDDHWLFQYN